MAKPLKLELVLNEQYPSKRKVSDPLPMQPMIVHDMTQMANFVYNYYMEKVKLMQDVYYVSLLVIFNN